MRKISFPAILAVIAAMASGCALFWVAQRVQTAETEYSVLQKKIASERDTIRVLDAEWSYLNRPERLEELAHQVLGMKAPKSTQIRAAQPDAIEGAADRETGANGVTEEGRKSSADEVPEQKTPDAEAIPAAITAVAPAAGETAQSSVYSAPIPRAKPKRHPAETSSIRNFQSILEDLETTP